MVEISPMFLERLQSQSDSAKRRIADIKGLKAGQIDVQHYEERLWNADKAFYTEDLMKQMLMATIAGKYDARLLLSTKDSKEADRNHTLRNAVADTFKGRGFLVNCFSMDNSEAYKMPVSEGYITIAPTLWICGVDVSWERQALDALQDQAVTIQVTESIQK